MRGAQPMMAGCRCRAPGLCVQHKGEKGARVPKAFRALGGAEGYPGTGIKTSLCLPPAALNERGLSLL